MLPRVRRLTRRRSGGHRDYQEQVLRIPRAPTYKEALRGTPRQWGVGVRHRLLREHVHRLPPGSKSH
jgi:hypothetical protein